jgi:hypothetical protein
MRCPGIGASSSSSSPLITAGGCAFHSVPTAPRGGLVSAIASGRARLMYVRVRSCACVDCLAGRTIGAAWCPVEVGRGGLGGGALAGERNTEIGGICVAFIPASHSHFRHSPHRSKTCRRTDRGRTTPLCPFMSGATCAGARTNAMSRLPGSPAMRSRHCATCCPPRPGSIHVGPCENEGTRRATPRMKGLAHLLHRLLRGLHLRPPPLRHV